MVKLALVADIEGDGKRVGRVWNALQASVSDSDINGGGRGQSTRPWIVKGLLRAVYRLENNQWKTNGSV